MLTTPFPKWIYKSFYKLIVHNESLTLRIGGSIFKQFNKRRALSSILSMIV